MNAASKESHAATTPETAERLKRAWLANVRQELLAPASAILGYAELLLEEARKHDLTALLTDLDRIADGGRGLLEQIDQILVLDVDAVVAVDETLADLESKLRHDLRNPLNAIKGYSELLLEDLDDLGGGPLRADLEILLAEAEQLLSQLDRIINFSRGSHEGIDTDSQSGTMVADFVRVMQPLSPDDSRRRETGRILVVDDNASNRGLLTRRLQREGHQVLEVASGRRALEVLGSRDVDLILLDLLMPELNGYELLAMLKADERLRGVPVVIISGLTDMDGIIRCIEAGAEDYLPKPINAVLLNARIGACLERKRWRDRERQYHSQIKREKERSEALLLNILPQQIVSRINSGEALIADRFDDVTVLFADLVGFTEVSSQMPPARLVEDLNLLISQFDALAQELAVEKVKTIGDAYMAAAGVPGLRPDHVEAIANYALGMMQILEGHNDVRATTWKIRIGVHCGPVVAGVIGTHKFVYDIWGDTVNQASRLQATSEPNRIHVSDQVAKALRPRYRLEPRGTVHLRGKGDVQSYFLLDRR